MSEYTNYVAIGLVLMLSMGGVILIANLDPSTGAAYRPVKKFLRDDCGNGICDTMESPNSCPSDCPVYCVDSDYGISIYKSGYAESDSGFYEDHCLDAYNLIEYYCQNDAVASWPTVCIAGCIHGACVIGVNGTNTTNP